MIRLRSLLALLAALAGLAVSPGAVKAAEIEIFQTDEFGTARLFRPVSAPTAFVYLFSNARGWGPAWDAAGAALAADGSAVLGIDLPQYLAQLDKENDDCLYPAAELENNARHLQRDFGLPQYLLPVLAGAGEGGSFVYLALSQAASVMFQGGVSLDPQPALETPSPFCNLKPVGAEEAHGFRYAPQAVQGWWRAAAEPGVAPDLAQMIAAAGPDAEQLPAHTGKDVPAKLVALLAPKLAAIAVASAAAADAAEESAGPGRISELGQQSLVEVPAKGTYRSPYLAIVYSGDSGWRDLDRTLAGILADRGIPAVGVDCLQYFWHPRTPAQVTDDLAGMIERYRQKWSARKVLLVGYSFGAGVLPFAYNALPDADKAAVAQISLLAPEPRAEFEVHMSGWFGAAPDMASPPLGPEIAKIDPGLVQCVYGEDDAKDSFCTTPDAAALDVIHTTGGHHFDGDYQGLADRILEGLRIGGASGRVESPDLLRRQAKTRARSSIAE